METTFADRLWWSRQQRGIGATRLARAVGCAQALISSLERGNSTSSKYAKAFARVLGVDPQWLATGNGPEPDGWDAKLAHDGREGMRTSDDPAKSTSVVQFNRRVPNWSREEAPPAPPDMETLQKRLITDFMDFARQAGTERTTALLEAFTHVRALAAFQGAEGKK